MSAAHELAETRVYWDEQASSFDKAADHGLRDPMVRAAWQDLFGAYMPPAPATVLDVGCGTGSISVLLARLGYAVMGIDLAPAMLMLARNKATRAKRTISFACMDAADPSFTPGQLDVIVGRHILWALPERGTVLRRWMELLRPGGRLILVEGFWHTGGGMHANEIVAALPSQMSIAALQDLSDQPDLWGQSVSDERFMLMALRNETKQ